MSAWLRTGSERSARQQQAFARPLPPDRVPDPVLLTVLSCPIYGATPRWDPFEKAARTVRTRERRCGWSWGSFPKKSVIKNGRSDHGWGFQGIHADDIIASGRFGYVDGLVKSGHAD
jgi:hypothetical protein